jgi:hypothetical protein
MRLGVWVGRQRRAREQLDLEQRARLDALTWLDVGS